MKRTLPLLDSVKYSVRLTCVQEEQKPIITSLNAAYTGQTHSRRGKCNHRNLSMPQILSDTKNALTDVTSYRPVDRWTGEQIIALIFLNQTCVSDAYGIYQTHMNRAMLVVSMLALLTLCHWLLTVRCVACKLGLSVVTQRTQRTQESTKQTQTQWTQEKYAANATAKTQGQERSCVSCVCCVAYVAWMESTL